MEYLTVDERSMVQLNKCRIAGMSYEEFCWWRIRRMRPHRTFYRLGKDKPFIAFKIPK